MAKKGAALGAALAALRKRSWHVCAVCEKRFSGISKAIYCSNACRQKAKHKRSKWVPVDAMLPPAGVRLWGWSKELDRATVYYVQDDPSEAKKHITHWRALTDRKPKDAPR